MRGGGGLAPASSEASRGKGRFGGSHTRRCTHKAVHTQDGLWPPQESCYLRGGAGADLCVERSEPRYSYGEGVGGEVQGGVQGGYGGRGWGGGRLRADYHPSSTEVVKTPGMHIPTL